MPIITNVVNSNPDHDEGNLIQLYVIKFVGDLRQVFSQVSATNKTDHLDIYKILLKVALKHNNHLIG